MIPDIVERDRGLGTAYERYCFYQRMEGWRTTYGIESMLEGPVDGMAGIHGVHGVGLARSGVHVTSALPSKAEADLAQGVYKSAAPAGAFDVLTTGFDSAAIRALPKADLVVCYHAVPFVADWRAYVEALASRARKLLVVTVCNPDNWGVDVVRLLALMRGKIGEHAPDVWHTETLAPALWSLGRVREHVYFDAPWWPDMQVKAGQSVTDRLRRLLVGRKEEVTLAAPVAGKLADKFVYDANRWPYFGDTDAWRNELLPAIIRHPGFDGGTGRLVARVAHLHGFVVDVRPRTPQARRRLGIVDDPHRT